MDSFRWILIVIGLIVIGLVYFVSTRNKTKKELVNNRPLINSQTNHDILFTEPGDVEESVDEPVLDNEPEFNEADNEAEEHLDVDDLDLASLFSHASAEPVDIIEVEAEQEQNNAASPYLLNGSIIVFHIKPRQKQSLWGNDVLSTLNEYGVQYGEMKVFHYAEEERNLFSILNMVEPGSFDISRLTAQQISGLTAIMQLDGIEKKERSFNTMIRKLGEIADVLDASIYDSQHEILTNQTLDAIRLAVADYAK